MLKIRINNGGIPLNGKIKISGAKNASLPIMVASLLTEEPLILSNVPDLADVRTLINLLGVLGADVTRTDESLNITSKNIISATAPYDLVKLMRASILVLGPLLARVGTAKVSMPGGCSIGVRPVDLHIKGLQKLGAEIELEDGYIIAKAPNGLCGAIIDFNIPTVTGTENIMMAATMAKGETIITNAAREPEISDLANCLNKMGAKISGHGTHEIRIQGVDKLSGTSHRIIDDRIEAGTYALATAITNGKVELLGQDLEKLLAGEIEILKTAGVNIEKTSDGLLVTSGERNPVNITTEPFPGFSTDLQAQMMAFLSLTSGMSVITENIWENRFLHVPELHRMGADISLKGSSAIIHGIKGFYGAPVMATDLRASFSLVIAGLAAQGTTLIDRTYHLARGYENAVEKLRACGADIEKIND